MTEDIYTRRYLLWSLQRALLGEVTPELRGVTARIEGRDVFSRFLFDVEITPEISERVSDAETEVIANYGGLARSASRPSSYRSRPIYDCSTTGVDAPAM